MRSRALPSVESKPMTALPIVTPEGVCLEFTVARAGDRLSAFLLDALVIAGISLALLVLWFLSFAASESGGAWLGALVLLAIFLLMNFYFIWFETRGRGMTPGKRRMGIRVMDADGGPLTGGAVIVRNVMRNIEVQLPVAVLLAPESLWPGAPGWAALFASVWILLLAGMPFFSAKRLRAGDLVAGTIVVVAPKAHLLGDLGSERSAGEVQAIARFHFAPAHLDAYGQFELQVLEDVLRRDGREAGQRRVLREVANRIGKKIGWPESIAAADAHTFLLEYYTALRARLEQKLLFGKRKRDKFHRDA